MVALIITIVVLLILAVVSIGAVKNSGIISHAQNAASDYQQAKLDEESFLKDYENILTIGKTGKIYRYKYKRKRCRPITSTYFR